MPLPKCQGYLLFRLRRLPNPHLASGPPTPIRLPIALGIHDPYALPLHALLLLHTAFMTHLLA